MHSKDIRIIKKSAASFSEVMARRLERGKAPCIKIMVHDTASILALATGFDSPLYAERGAWLDSMTNTISRQQGRVEIDVSSIYTKARKDEYREITKREQSDSREYFFYFRGGDSAKASYELPLTPDSVYDFRKFMMEKVLKVENYQYITRMGPLEAAELKTGSEQAIKRAAQKAPIITAIFNDSAKKILDVIECDPARDERELFTTRIQDRFNEMTRGGVLTIEAAMFHPTKTIETHVFNKGYLQTLGLGKNIQRTLMNGPMHNRHYEP